MEQENKKIAFTVHEELCIGCGICVDACPMKILEIEDDICIMTDESKCLECGTCIRECPKDAIVIPGVKLSEEKEKRAKKEPVASSVSRKDEADEKFTPILQHLNDLLQEINPVQMFELGGTDIKRLDEFELEGEMCYYRLYKAEKLEKIGISRMNFYGSMVADVLSITPGPDYDIPYYIIDWDESEGHIFFICDIMPSDDVGRNLEQLKKYFYEPLEDLYFTYSAIPGMKPSVFHWVRAIHSPYLITGTIEKTKENIDKLYQCAVDYFNVWLKLYKDARPLDSDSDYMNLVRERRRAIRQLYKENDPGVGTLNKFLGDHLAEISLSIIEP